MSKKDDNVIQLDEWRARKGDDDVAHAVSRVSRLLSILKEQSKTFTYGDEVTWNSFGKDLEGRVMKSNDTHTLVRHFDDIWAEWIPTWKLHPIKKEID